MTKVIESDVVKPRAGADSPSQVLKVREMRPALASGDHPRIVVRAGKGCEQANR